MGASFVILIGFQISSGDGICTSLGYMNRNSSFFSNESPYATVNLRIHRVSVSPIFKSFGIGIEIIIGSKGSLNISLEENGHKTPRWYGFSQLPPPPKIMRILLSWSLPCNFIFALPRVATLPWFNLFSIKFRALKEKDC